MDLFTNSNGFINSVFNLDELSFCITVKLATLLDVFDQSRC